MKVGCLAYDLGVFGLERFLDRVQLLQVGLFLRHQLLLSLFEPGVRLVLGGRRNLICEAKLHLLSLRIVLLL